MGVGLRQAPGQVGDLAGLDAVRGIGAVNGVGIIALLRANQGDGGVLIHAFRNLHGLVGKGVQALGGHVDIQRGEPVRQDGNPHVDGHHNGDEHHAEQGGHAAPLKPVGGEGVLPFPLGGLALLLFYLLCLILFRFHCFLPPLAPTAALHLAGGEKDEHGGHA